jgi:hypothetical protein
MVMMMMTMMMMMMQRRRRDEEHQRTERSYLRAKVWKLVAKGVARGMADQVGH